MGQCALTERKAHATYAQKPSNFNRISIEFQSKNIVTFQSKPPTFEPTTQAILTTTRLFKILSGIPLTYGLYFQSPSPAMCPPAPPRHQNPASRYVFNAVCCVYACRRLIDLSTDCRYAAAMDDMPHHQLMKHDNYKQDARRIPGGLIAMVAPPPPPPAKHGYVLDAVCFINACRRLIDLSLIAGTRCSESGTACPTRQISTTVRRAMKWPFFQY